MDYSRVLPIVGNLKNKIVGFANLNLEIINYLSSCGIVNFRYLENENIKANKIKKILENHNPSENYSIQPLKNFDEIDIFISIQPNNFKFSKDNTKTIFLSGGFFCSGEYFISLDKNINFEFQQKESYDYFNYLDFINQISHYANALLLKDTIYSQPEITKYLEEKITIIDGNKKWYWNSKPLTNQNIESINKKTLKQLDKTIMIIGCGSVGSIIAKDIKPLVTKLVLIDGKDVSKFNPIRQEYHTHQIGQEKVDALTENLKINFEEDINLITDKQTEIIPISINFEEKNINDFQSILKKEKPDLVILSTGSMDDYLLSSILFEQNIPHISTRCYPRAKWFEIITVIPKITPCFGCLRGHLYTGKKPSLTPEQELRYDPNFREGDLDSEPAIKLDSARCGEIGARIAYQILTDDKENWFKSLINYKRTCLIGGNRVENNEDNFCYGISKPYQVVAYGIQDIKNDLRECLYCGRKLSDFTKEV